MIKSYDYETIQMKGESLYDFLERSKNNFPDGFRFEFAEGDDCRDNGFEVIPKGERLIAIIENIKVMELINEPKEEVLLDLIRKNGNIIKYIKNEDKTQKVVEEFFNFVEEHIDDFADSASLFISLNSKFISKQNGLTMIQCDPYNINLLSDELKEEILEMKPELKRFVNGRM